MHSLPVLHSVVGAVEAGDVVGAGHVGGHRTEGIHLLLLPLILLANHKLIGRRRGQKAEHYTLYTLTSQPSKDH